MIVIQDYEAASESFLKCLAIEKNQPTAMLYHGLSLYHRGKVKVNKCIVSEGGEILSCTRNACKISFSG